MVEQLADLTRTLAFGAAVYCVLTMQGRGRRSHTFVQSYGSDKSSAPVTDRHRQEKTRPTNPLEGDTFIAMSDAPKPASNSTTGKTAAVDEPDQGEIAEHYQRVGNRPTTEAEKVEMLRKLGYLTWDDPPRTIARPLGSDDRYLTPKTSRA